MFFYPFLFTGNRAPSCFPNSRLKSSKLASFHSSLITHWFEREEIYSSFPAVTNLVREYLWTGGSSNLFCKSKTQRINIPLQFCITFDDLHFPRSPTQITKRWNAFLYLCWFHISMPENIRKLLAYKIIKQQREWVIYFSTVFSFRVPQSHPWHLPFLRYLTKTENDFVFFTLCRTFGRKLLLWAK